MVVKTYRGLLADGAQEKIALATKDGSVGYRIKKFDVFPSLPGSVAQQSTVKIWKTSQGTPVNAVNFTDSDLLGAAYLGIHDGAYYGTAYVIVFDTEIFNQDIFINLYNDSGSPACNYYLELEQMKLDHTQNMSATLKAIRGAAVD